MCGRFNLTASEDELKTHFRLTQLSGLESSYNIPPGQQILSIIQPDGEACQAVWLYWGLVPFWSKDPKISHSLFNARAESVAEKPSFRTAFRQRRCLIPATGFYEWQSTDSGKQAYHICRRDHSLFAFAGLWDCNDASGQALYTCTVITTEATALMAPIHQRMPVIIPRENYERWLDKHASTEQLKVLLANPAYQDMVAVPISDRVNNPLHNDGQCLL